MNYKEKKQSFIRVTNYEIIRYYQKCWDLSKRYSKEALSKLNIELGEIADISETDYVLDAGCGLGGSALHIANNKGCRVHGITLDIEHSKYANEKARFEGLENLALFSVGDYTNTKFGSNTFDVVWAIESICHAPEKKNFLNEAFRILKPGGRLIISDFFRAIANPSDQETNWLNLFSHNWAVPYYDHIDHFLCHARQLGFKQIATYNTKKALPKLHQTHSFYDQNKNHFYLKSPISLQDSDLGKQYLHHKIIYAVKPSAGSR